MRDGRERSRRMVAALESVLRSANATEVRIVTAWPTRAPCWRDLCAMFTRLKYRTTDRIDGDRFTVTGRRRREADG